MKYIKCESCGSETKNTMGICDACYLNRELSGNPMIGFYTEPESSNMTRTYYNGRLTKEIAHQYKEELCFLYNQLKEIESSNDITESERFSIKSSIKELELDKIDFFGDYNLSANFVRFCDFQDVIENKKLPEEQEDYIPESALTEKRIVLETLDYTLPIEPEWYIGMSNEFIKSMRNIDRKMQGRILEALKILSAEPKTPRADTIKALTGDLNGPWRYRIGDFRLIYHADSIKKRILLLSFEACGKVYN